MSINISAAFIAAVVSFDVLSTARSDDYPRITRQPFVVNRRFAWLPNV